MSPTEKNQSSRDPQAAAVPRELERALDAVKAFRNVPVELSIELGKGKLTIGDLLGLRYHSIFQLDKNAGGRLDVYVNGVLLATAEPIVMDDRLGIKIDEILEPESESAF